MVPVSVHGIEGSETDSLYITSSFLISFSIIFTLVSIRVSTQSENQTFGPILDQIVKTLQNGSEYWTNFDHLLLKLMILVL